MPAGFIWQRGFPTPADVFNSDFRLRQNSDGLYALADTEPPKPGLVRQSEGGAMIEVEVWALSEEAFGQFTADVPAPLAIGNVELRDGRWVKGFVCEPWGLKDARDITGFGGWRAFLKTPK